MIPSFILICWNIFSMLSVPILWKSTLSSPSKVMQSISLTACSHCSMSTPMNIVLSWSTGIVLPINSNRAHVSSRDTFDALSSPSVRTIWTKLYCWNVPSLLIRVWSLSISVMPVQMASLIAVVFDGVMRLILSVSVWFFTNSNPTSWKTAADNKAPIKRFSSSDLSFMQSSYRFKFSSSEFILFYNILDLKLI